MKGGRRLGSWVGGKDIGKEDNQNPFPVGQSLLP